jgi:hypothetical protein
MVLFVLVEACSAGMQRRGCEQRSLLGASSSEPVTCVIGLVLRSQKQGGTFGFDQQLVDDTNRAVDRGNTAGGTVAERDSGRLRHTRLRACAVSQPRSVLESTGHSRPSGRLGQPDDDSVHAEWAFGPDWQTPDHRDVGPANDKTTTPSGAVERSRARQAPPGRPFAVALDDLRVSERCRREGSGWAERAAGPCDLWRREAHSGTPDPCACAHLCEHVGHPFGGAPDGRSTLKRMAACGQPVLAVVPGNGCHGR